jgi:hypothetical protein
LLILLVIFSTRLKNIEETEKAKRIVAEERQDNHHLAASRCQFLLLSVPPLFVLTPQKNKVFRPNLKQKSDADILREAKLEAMGVPVQDEHGQKSYRERPQMATDEMVIKTCSLVLIYIYISKTVFLS